MGIGTFGSLIQVFATEDGSEFTIVITPPNKLSCIVVTGKDWQQLTPMFSDLKG